MSDILLTRQPIFNSYLNLVGYELVYKNTHPESNNTTEQARTTVILNALSEIGLPKLASDYPVFINFTRDLLLSAPWSILPRDKVVIEIPSAIEIDEILLDALRKAKHFGYQIALDNFEFSDKVRPLLELANIIKLNLNDLSEEQLQKNLTYLQSYTVEFLADNVETYVLFDKCKHLGFDYFQGHFFSEPSIVAKDTLQDNQKAVLQIVGKLHSTNPNIAEIETLLENESSLKGKLFKIINSPFYALSKPVNTLQEAVDAIGIEQIKNWMNMIMLCSSSNKPLEFFSVIIQRAAMCRLLAGKLGLDGQEAFFTIGLFSALNGLLDVPMGKLLPTLQIQPSFKDALLNYEGPTGKILALVLAYERGDWAQANFPSLTDKDLFDAYVQSIEWAKNVISIIGQPK